VIRLNSFIQQLLPQAMKANHTLAVMASLGYAGLLPFYACALWVVLPDAPGQALAGQIFVVYGVVILAFLGGTLWGNAVARPPPQKYSRLVISNLVALFAALAGLAGNLVTASLLLALGQVALLLYERGTGDARGWYLRLRSRLTLGVLPAHGLYTLGVMA
jgi:hypothetical protein